MQTFLDLDGRQSGECVMERVESKEAIASLIGRKVSRSIFCWMRKRRRDEKQEFATD